MISSLMDSRAAPAKRVPHLGSVIKRAFANAVKAWRMAKAQRRIAVELGALNDHVLKDIGIPRDMLDVVALDLVTEDGQDRQA